MDHESDRLLLRGQPSNARARFEGEPKHYVAALLELGHHHNAAIVRALAGEPLRYNELLATLADLPEPALGASLRELDSDGLVRRRVDPGPPLRVIYELTALGLDLAPSLGAIEAWARRTTAVPIS